MSISRILFAGLMLLGLAACTTPAVYGPREPGQTTGYTDERLSDNRYRVTYTGNAATARETVEDFLMLRAAEVTLQSGFSHFVFDTRDTQARTTYYSSFVDGWPGWGRRRGYGWYWHNWPYDEDVATTSITRYQAYAEIVMLSDDQAKAEPRAIDAHEIVANLGPKANPPPPPAH